MAGGQKHSAQMILDVIRSLQTLRLVPEGTRKCRKDLPTPSSSLPGAAEAQAPASFGHFLRGVVGLHSGSKQAPENAEKTCTPPQTPWQAQPKPGPQHAFGIFSRDAVGFGSSSHAFCGNDSVCIRSLAFGVPTGTRKCQKTFPPAPTP